MAENVCSGKSTAQVQEKRGEEGGWEVLEKGGGNEKGSRRG